MNWQFQTRLIGTFYNVSKKHLPLDVAGSNSGTQMRKGQTPLAPL
jgi:hypothetical protein